MFVSSSMHSQYCVRKCVHVALWDWLKIRCSGTKQHYRAPLCAAKRVCVTVLSSKPACQQRGNLLVWMKEGVIGPQQPSRRTSQMTCFRQFGGYQETGERETVTQQRVNGLHYFKDSQRFHNDPFITKHSSVMDVSVQNTSRWLRWQVCVRVWNIPGISFP